MIMNLVLLTLLNSSSSASTNEELLKRIIALEQRVQALENQKQSTGLKTANLKGKKIDQSQAPPSKELKEMQEKIETLNKRKKETQKYLDELMEEN